MQKICDASSGNRSVKVSHNYPGSKVVDSYHNDDEMVLEDPPDITPGTRLTRNLSNSSMNSMESLEQLSDGIFSSDCTDISQSSSILLLQNCVRSNMYFLGLYSSCTITLCFDSEIVIGAVSGAVIISGCERIKLSVTCRKLILINCYDCDIQLATLTPTITTGVCRGITIGYYFLLCILYYYHGQLTYYHYCL
jgi:hypothetical protein